MERKEYFEELVRLQEEECDLYVPPLCLTNWHPKKKFPRFHDKGSYNKFHHIISRPPEDQSLQQQLEVSEYLVSLYSQYVNSKGRRLDQVRDSGIDKKSDSYIPHLKNKGYYGASYSIKILNNTFINQI